MNLQLNKYPLVSIVSINYNGAAVTCEMLESLKQITYPNFEVIIIDNASKENPDSIFEIHPWITFLKSEKNLGFAGGNNLGFKVAKGKYFLMLNNDTEVDPGFLEPLVTRMENENGIGAVSPKIIFHHTPGMLQFAGFNPINPYTGRGTAIGFGMQDDGRFDNSMPTSRAHGAAMMIRKSAVEEIGLMADLYFLCHRYYLSRRRTHRPRHRCLHHPHHDSRRALPLRKHPARPGRRLHLPHPRQGK